MTSLLLDELFGTQPGPMTSPMWNPMASAGLPVLGMGGRLSGCDPRLPQQQVHQAQQRAQFNCARFPRVTTSGIYGVGLNFKGLEPYHDFCIGLFFWGQIVC